MAKIASDYNKPNGLYVITPKMAENFIEQLPIKKFHGIGKVTAKRMQMMGIHTGAELKTIELEKLRREFGKSGQYYYNIARGLDFREVNPTRIRKSSGSENTFIEDLETITEMESALNPLMEDVWNWSLKTNIYGRTITVKIKYNDFTQYTRSLTKEKFYENQLEFYRVGLQLWEQRPYDKPIRLLGLAISNLNNESVKKVSIQLKIPFQEFENE